MHKVWGKRALLNPPGRHSTSAIVAEVVRNSYGWECTLKISDCERCVSLALTGPTGDTEEFAADLYKIDTMIDALKSLRRGLLLARKREGLL